MPAVRVLVVEDDEMVRAVCENFLTSEGYQVWAVETPQEARALAEEVEFDVALLDYGLPGETGVELFLALKQKFPHLIGILMTAGYLPHVLEECEEAGFHGFLPKPFALEDLLHLLTTRW